MIRLPEFLALPLFKRVYPLLRRREGSPIPPIQRRISQVDLKASYAFNRIFNASLLYQLHCPIEYDLPYPKLDFLNYLCDWRGLVAHGSHSSNLLELAPIRRSEEVSDLPYIQPVFAFPDAVMALWFAILDPKQVHATSNGCVCIGRELKREKYYHFELPSMLEGKFPFTPGTIYIARAESFPIRQKTRSLNFFGADHEQWGSESSVTPLAKITVEPQDFPYLDQVQYCL